MAVLLIRANLGPGTCCGSLLCLLSRGLGRGRARDVTVIIRMTMTAGNINIGRLYFIVLSTFRGLMQV
jgi:hypothetical protein